MLHTRFYKSYTIFSFIQINKGYMMKKIITSAVTAMVLLSVHASANEADKKVEVKTEVVQKSLYDRLGGRANIEAVVFKLWEFVSQDNRINSYFGATDPKVFGGLLTDFLCVGAGGPCKYTGRSMKETHHGMQITDAHFTALAEDTVKALDFYKVPEKEKNEVMALLGSLKGDVVEK